MPLSAKQMEYLAVAWQCFETEPKMDWDKFARVAGMKTPASARECMRVTKNKLKDEYGALGGVATSGTTKSATKAVTKSKVTKSTPGSNKPRAKAGKKSDAEVRPTADEDDDDEMMATPSKEMKKAETETEAEAEVAVKSEPEEEEAQADDGSSEFDLL